MNSEDSQILKELRIKVDSFDDKLELGPLDLQDMEERHNCKKKIFETENAKNHGLKAKGKN